MIAFQKKDFSMRSETIVNISTYVSTISEVGLLVLLIYKKFQYRSSSYWIGWGALSCAMVAVIVTRIMTILKMSEALRTVFTFITQPAFVIFFASMVNRYAGYFKLRFLDFKNGAFGVPWILQDSHYYPFLYGSIAIVSIVSVYVMTALGLHFISPRHFKEPEYLMWRVVSTLLAFAWNIFAIVVTNKFIKSLKSIKRTLLKDTIEVIIKSTKSIRNSMISTMLMFTFLVSIVSFQNSILAQLGTRIFITLGLLFDTLAFIEAQKSEYLYKSTQTMNEYEAKSSLSMPTSSSSDIDV